MLKCSLSLSIPFSNSVSILISKALNSLSGKLFISVSLFVFQRFSLALSINSSSSAFFILLNFPSMTSCETVTAVLKVFLCGSIPIHIAWVQSLWWRARFDVVANLNFSSGCADSYHLGSGWSGDGGARAGIRCEMGLPLCSLTIATLLGMTSDPRLLKQKL